MNKKIVIFITVFMFLKSGFLTAQESRDYKPLFLKGISFSQGIGKYSVRDNFISGEKYSGMLPDFSAQWSNFTENGGYGFGLEYRNSSEIKNYSVLTDITQFSLNLDYLYSFGQLELFSKDVFIYLGPASEFFLYFNHPDIDGEVIYSSFSFASLFSLGVNSAFLMPVRNNLRIESVVRVSLLSVGLRMIDMMENDESPMKLLTLLSGMKTSAGLGIRYRLHKSVSVKVAYQMQIVSIRKWENLLAASDTIIGTVTIHLLR